jgi:hypothetical protein
MRPKAIFSASTIPEARVNNGQKQNNSVALHIHPIRRKAAALGGEGAGYHKDQRWLDNTYQPKPATPQDKGKRTSLSCGVRQSQ